MGDGWARTTSPALAERDRRIQALLERVTVLERALEKIAGPTVIDPICREYPSIKRLQGIAQDALDA